MARNRMASPRLILALLSLTALLSACGGVGTFSPTKTEIVSYTFSPASPATLKIGDDVIASLSYVSGSAEPIRMWARIKYNGPIKEGTLSYCPSKAISAKKGVEERCFSVTRSAIDGVPAPLHADTIELSITNHSQSKTLFEQLVPVDYTWEP